jgi:hypothetical protein
MRAKLASYFERKERASGEKFYTLVDSRPDWLYDAVHECHSSDLPNDWIYTECQAACEAIDAGDLDGDRYGDDSVHDYADDRVDVYTRALYQWAGNMCHTYVYANAEAAAGDSGTEKRSIEDRFKEIQYYAIVTITGTILDAYTISKEDEAKENEDASEDASE